MKKYKLKGKLEIYEQEGGFAADQVIINGEDLGDYLKGIFLPDRKGIDFWEKDNIEIIIICEKEYRK